MRRFDGDRSCSTIVLQTIDVTPYQYMPLYKPYMRAFEEPRRFKLIYQLCGFGSRRQVEQCDVQ